MRTVPERTAGHHSAGAIGSATIRGCSGASRATRWSLATVQERLTPAGADGKFTGGTAGTAGRETGRRSDISGKVYVCVPTPGWRSRRPVGCRLGCGRGSGGPGNVPRNRLLFGMFHRVRMVDQIGSGIRRIRLECRDYSVAEPLIEVFDNCVTTTFRRPAVQAEKDAGCNGSPSGANTKSAAGQYTA